MNKIYVVRHGESTWNAEKKWAGSANPPLTEKGRKQAKEACCQLSQFNFAYVSSSSLQRARETASIISNELSLKVLQPIDELNERDFGDITGLSGTAAQEKYPRFVDDWNSGKPGKAPGGEAWTDFVKRVNSGLRQLSSVPGNVLVVAHMGVLRAIDYSLEQEQKRHENLAGIWLDANDLPADLELLDTPEPALEG